MIPETIADRVIEVTEKEGSGDTFALAGTAGGHQQAFATAFTEGESITCFVTDNETAWECFDATFTGGNVLRTNQTASSAAGAKIDWPEGEKTIVATPTAAYWERLITELASKADAAATAAALTAKADAAATSAALALKAPLASPTFTGVINGPATILAGNLTFSTAGLELRLGPGGASDIALAMFGGNAAFYNIVGGAWAGISCGSLVAQTGDVLVAGNVRAGATAQVLWQNRTIMRSPADGELLVEKADGTDLLKVDGSATSAALGSTNYLHTPNLQSDGVVVFNSGAGLFVGIDGASSSVSSVFYGNASGLANVYVKGSGASGPAGYGWRHYTGTNAWELMLDVNGSTQRHMTLRYKSALGVQAKPMFFAEGGQAVGFASDCAFGFYNSTTPETATMDCRHRRTAAKTETVDDGAAGAMTLSVTGQIIASTYVKAGSSTVALLPSASAVGAGARMWATNGRKSGEGAGVGTGVSVESDGTNWLSNVYTGTTVAA